MTDSVFVFIICFECEKLNALVGFGCFYLFSSPSYDIKYVNAI